ncbi:MED16 isoform 9, partial [Pan troglodytes]
MCDLRRPAAGGMMDLAYVCEWEKWSKSTHCPSVPLACAWSCRNLIAFTMDLRSDDQDLTRMIHILDTEHPWDLHSIPSEHREAITCLEWDQSGSRLLSADADGQIKCWSMADHLANSWESSVGSLVEGDPIVALSWLHNGVKLALHVEKVLLCASSQTSSIVECWSLRKEGLPVNNIFQQISPVVGDKQPTILKWRILSATNDLDRVSAVALPKLPISLTNTDLKVASDTQFYPGLGLALAFHDGSVHIVHRLSLQTMAVFYSSAAPRPVDEPAMKRPRTAGPAVHLKAMQLSWTSLALVGIDNQSVLRLSPSMGHPLEVGLALRHLLFLLEYCMVTGYDWWDILLHVQPSMVQSLVEKLHEEYTRQTAALQQVLSTRILAMKASLCKLSPCTVTRVCDYHTKLFLIAISSTLKSLLRPHFLNTPDKSPGDRLTEICTKITDVDIDKVMINLKTEEFVL